MSSRVETGIIGAGQAGLALSRLLTELGRDHIVLERGRVAERWRSERWDSFRLLSPNWHTRLPGYRYAGPDPDGFMDKREIVRFLEGYAASFPVPLRTGVAVTAVAPEDGGWTVRTTAGRYAARHVVVATGHYDVAYVPPLACSLPPGIVQLTVPEYRNPAQLPPGPCSSSARDRPGSRSPPSSPPRAGASTWRWAATAPCRAAAGAATCTGGWTAWACSPRPWTTWPPPASRARPQCRAGRGRGPGPPPAGGPRGGAARPADRCGGPHRGLRRRSSGTARRGGRREPDGRWYASLAVETDAEPEPLPAAGRAAGVDLGVKDFAVTGDGERIPNPRHLERKARNLARYQRRMARKQAGSNNRAKAKVTRAHAKIRDARADFLHKTTTRPARSHDVIAIEDLNVAGMIRNRKLAKAISDCGWGEFRRLLEYKCARYGRALVVIGRWHPTSKTCSACGHLRSGLSLSTRRWRCPACGTRHGRDINAAKNILAAGRAVTACGVDVRHSGSSRVRPAVKQEARPARAGIPRL